MSLRLGTFTIYSATTSRFCTVRWCVLSTQAGKLVTEEMTEGASLKRGVICSAELARGLGGLTSCLEATGWGWEVLLFVWRLQVGALEVLLLVWRLQGLR